LDAKPQPNQKHMFYNVVPCVLKQGTRSHMDMAMAQPSIDRDVKELYLAGEASCFCDGAGPGRPSHRIGV